MGTHINRFITMVLALYGGFHHEHDDSGSAPMAVPHPDDLAEREAQGAVVERALAGITPVESMPIGHRFFATPPQDYHDPSIYSWVQGPSPALLASAAGAK